MIDTIEAVIDADVGHQDFEETRAASTGQRSAIDEPRRGQRLQLVAAVAANVIFSASDECPKLIRGFSY